MARMAWAKTVDIMVVGDIAGFEVDFGNAFVVAGDETVENFGQVAAFATSQASGDAEVDCDDVGPIIDKQIARVHVRMEKPIAQYMAQKTLIQGVGDGWNVMTGCDKGVHITELRPFNPIHGQASRDLCIPSPTPGTRKPASSAVFSPISENARGFQPQVHFQFCRCRQHINDQDRLQPFRHRNMTLHGACCTIKCL